MSDLVARTTVEVVSVMVILGAVLWVVVFNIASGASNFSVRVAQHNLR